MWTNSFGGNGNPIHFYLDSGITGLPSTYPVSSGFSVRCVLDLNNKITDKHYSSATCGRVPSTVLHGVMHAMMAAVRVHTITTAVLTLYGVVSPHQERRIQRTSIMAD